eukprot:gene12515-15728_t
MDSPRARHTPCSSASIPDDTHPPMSKATMDSPRARHSPSSSPSIPDDAHPPMYKRSTMDLNQSLDERESKVKRGRSEAPELSFGESNPENGPNYSKSHSQPLPYGINPGSNRSSAQLSSTPAQLNSTAAQLSAAQPQLIAARSHPADESSCYAPCGLMLTMTMDDDDALNCHLSEPSCSPHFAHGSHLPSLRPPVAAPLGRRTTGRASADMPRLHAVRTRPPFQEDLSCLSRSAPGVCSMLTQATAGSPSFDIHESSDPSTFSFHPLIDILPGVEEMSRARRRAPPRRYPRPSYLCVDSEATLWS